MKLSTTDKRVKILKDLYMSIPNLLTAYYYDAFNLEINQPIFYRVALDHVADSAWMNKIKPPAIHNMNYLQLKAVVKIMAKYKNNPNILYSHIRISNKYRTGNRISENIIDGLANIIIKPL